MSDQIATHVTDPIQFQGTLATHIPRRRKAGAVFAAIALGISGLSLASPADAADNGITPESGPVAGGTTVTVPAPVTDLNFESFEAMSSGSLAITAEGDAYGWGANAAGSLASASRTNT
jgi:hypothetical protein